MSRSARLHVPGGVFHIISRCLNHAYLFDGALERARYLALLEAAARRNDARVLAWCVMSNHVHLVVRAGEAPLSRLMKRVNTGYARWKNIKERRIGPVFAGRYKAILVERETYLLELIRYVHLNPVRAGIVEHPDEDRWSSHRVYAGIEKKPVFLDTAFVLKDFGGTASERRQAYRTFIDDGLESTVRSPVFAGDEWLQLAKEAWRVTGRDVLVSDPIIGSQTWTEEVLAQVKARGKAKEKTPRAEARRDPKAPSPLLDDLVDLVCDVLDVPREVFDLRPKTRGASLARQLLVRIWVEDYRRTQLELARLLKVHAVLVSRWYAKAVERIAEQHDSLTEVRDRLPQLEAPVVLASGQQVLPHKGPVRSSFHIEVLDERAELLSEDDE